MAWLFARLRSGNEAVELLALGNKKLIKVSLRHVIIHIDFFGQSTKINELPVVLLLQK